MLTKMSEIIYPKRQIMSAFLESGGTGCELKAWNMRKHKELN